MAITLMLRRATLGYGADAMRALREAIKAAFASGIPAGVEPRALPEAMHA